MKLALKINCILVVFVICILGAVFLVVDNHEKQMKKDLHTKDVEAEMVIDLLHRQISQIFIDINGVNSKLLNSSIERISKSDFFYNLIIFNNKTEIIDSIKKDPYEVDNDPVYYKQIRADVLSGKSQRKTIERLSNGHTLIVYLIPITQYDENAKKVNIIGLVEITTQKESYLEEIGIFKIRMLGISTLSILVLIIVLSSFLNKKVIQPIREYSVVAQRVAGGDFNQKVDSHTQDEIGELGTVFNSMITSIRELDQTKSDFTSVAAHQLRTPLSGVKWVLKLLLDGDVGLITDDQKGILKQGYEASEKMSKLVNNLLSVARIENNKLGYKFEKSNFMELLNVLANSIDLLSKKNNIKVQFKNRAGIIPEFIFDYEKLLTALQNIVDNAIKYTLPGGRVDIDVQQKGMSIEIKVIDTGVGIPKESVPKLFSKFFRAANVIYLQTEGTGLGLFLVKSIITRHGGQVLIDSVEGKGTTVIVLIPMSTTSLR